MQVLELKDMAAGVLARSYRREDWVQFLDLCIARKREEINRLDGIDPFGAALIEAEIERLRTIRGLITGAIPYRDFAPEDNGDADGVDDDNAQT
jgi:hypothetical protein